MSKPILVQVRRHIVDLLLVLIAACSPVEPIPSPRFDASYAGPWQSGDQGRCGVSAMHGNAVAEIHAGHVSVHIEHQRDLDGTVASDGFVRASGIWRSPAEHFPQVTIFEGHIEHDTIEGVATNYRCQTTLRLHKVIAPARKRMIPVRTHKPQDGRQPKRSHR